MRERVCLVSLVDCCLDNESVLQQIRAEEELISLVNLGLS